MANRGYIESDMSCGSELDGIGNKVVDDLLYSIDIAFDYCIRTYELMFKEKSFVIDGLCGTIYHTIQQIGYSEWHRVHRLFRLIKAIDIQEVVYKMKDMLAASQHLFQLQVAFLLLPCIHSQLRITDDIVERTSYVVRDGQDNLVSHFKEFGIFAVACLQLAATTLYARSHA